MNVKVRDLMVENVITTRPHQTVNHVRGIMERNHIHALPVVDSDGTAIGIVSASDLVADVRGGSPISSVMSEKVYVVAEYDGVHVAARIMRNHDIHRVVVTREQKVIGILSAFDLLKLVEDHRFVLKNPPTRQARKAPRTKRATTTPQ